MTPQYRCNLKIPPIYLFGSENLKRNGVYDSPIQIQLFSTIRCIKIQILRTLAEATQIIIYSKEFATIRFSQNLLNHYYLNILFKYFSRTRNFVPFNILLKNFSHSIGTMIIHDYLLLPAVSAFSIWECHQLGQFHMKSRMFASCLHETYMKYWMCLLLYPPERKEGPRRLHTYIMCWESHFVDPVYHCIIQCALMSWCLMTQCLHVQYIIITFLEDICLQDKRTDRWATFYLHAKNIQNNTIATAHMCSHPSWNWTYIYIHVSPFISCFPTFRLPLVYNFPAYYGV